MKSKDSLINYLKKRKRNAFIVLGIFLSLSIFLSLGNANFSKKSIIAKINLEGIINDKKEFIRLLEETAVDKNIKGLLVIINSPGGTFVSSKEVFDALERVSKEMPTTAYMREMGTSGAYLASLGVDKVFVNHGTITGSIGVILQTAELTSLLNKIGIDPIIIKSGKFKATPNPLEAFDFESQNYMEKIVVQLQEEFIDLVKKKRNLDKKSVEKIADGRIFTSKEALDLNLVDYVGNEMDAINWLKKEGDLDEFTEIIELNNKKSLFDFLKLSVIKNSLNHFKLNLNNGILAIWVPGL
tara:strand:+ start:2966 stop:3859 length:894 start_codon:yes stop_codon:yes gene_type:complete